MNYLKYYFLEKYLFGEVRNNFKRNQCLSPEEFFCIVIWKRNASKTKIKRGIKTINKTVHTITSDIYKAKGRKQKLKILTSIPNVGIAIASAILTVLYPKDFTVYDYHVLGEINKGKKEEEKIKDFSYSKNMISEYFKFLNEVKKIAKSKNLSLRDADRYLWGRSFYQDLKEFLRNNTK